MAPWAVSSTAQIPTCPSQPTLGPTSGPAWSAPAATSQPSTSPTGAATASALPFPGSGTLPCRAQLDSGAPASASMVRTSSPPAGWARGPAAHATTRPGSHDTCSCTTPGSSSSSSGSRPLSAPGCCAVSRAQAADSWRRSAERSATTWSRSSPGSLRALARCSSASRQEPQQGRAPRRAIRVEDRDLLGGRVPVGFRGDVHLELGGADLGRRGRGRHRLGTAHPGPGRREMASPAMIVRLMQLPNGGFVGGHSRRPRRSTFGGARSRVSPGP